MKKMKCVVSIFILSFFTLNAYAGLNWPLKLKAAHVQEVTAGNASNFYFSGYCESGKGDVTINFGSLTFSAPCNPILGVYAIYRDVTAEISANPVRQCASQTDNVNSCSPYVNNTLAPPHLILESSPLELITLQNVSNYSIKGACAPMGAAVQASISGVSGVLSGSCGEGFSLNLSGNVSALSDGTNLPVVLNIQSGGQSTNISTRVSKVSQLDPAPFITQVTAQYLDADSDGWLEAGDSITIEVEVSEEVSADSSVVLNLFLQSGAATASLVSGSGSRLLRFTYIISAGDTQCNAVVGLSGISLAGAGVKDSNGQNLETGNLPASLTVLPVDALAPAFQGGFFLASSDASSSSSPMIVGDGFEVQDSCSSNLSVNAVIKESVSGSILQNKTALPAATQTNKSYRFVDGQDGFSFSFVPSLLYTAAFYVRDAAGNESSTEVDSAWAFSSAATLPDLVAHLSGKTPIEILDASGVNATNPAFSGEVNIFRDISQSAATHHFTSRSGGQRPNYNSGTQELVFDGVNDCMRTANHADLNTATVTERSFSLLFRSGADVNTRQTIYEEGAQVRGMNVYISSGRVYCGFWNDRNDGDGQQPFVGESAPISANTVYNVVPVFDYSNYGGSSGPDGSFTCYINGVKMSATGHPVTSRLYAHGGDVSLGCVGDRTIQHDGQASNKQYFKGSLLEFLIFNNAPTEQEVLDVQDYLETTWSL